jgi:Protein of unknown function (DUF3602)
VGKPVERPGQPHDAEVVPETATRIAKEESHHFGRGGAGNEAHVQERQKGEGLMDKAKHALHREKKK